MSGVRGLLHWSWRWKALAKQLRADLATVTAERDAIRLDYLAAFADRATMTDALAAEKRAHVETRKALEETEARWRNAWATVDSTRADKAEAEARVKAALNYYDGQGSVCDHMREMVRLLRG